MSNTADSQVISLSNNLVDESSTVTTLSHYAGKVTALFSR